MGTRVVSIWLRYFATDWFSLRQPALKQQPFVLRTPSHGRMVVSGINAVAEREGAHTNDVLADVRALIPNLQVADDAPEKLQLALTKLATWCIRFTPFVAIDPPDGIFLDATGCAHLWGSEENYLNDIVKKVTQRGYYVRVAMADTAGAAWAVARYARDAGNYLIVPPQQHGRALHMLPPECLRMDAASAALLHKLGLRHVKQLMKIPASALRRRFGPLLLMQLNKALGYELEMLQPVQPIEPYQERLPCLEPIVTSQGIEIALKNLLERLCLRLQREEKGVRKCIFKCLRVDGKIESISIATHSASHHVPHLYHLFEIKIQHIEPALGIELFMLEAPKVESLVPAQSKMWEGSGGLHDQRLAELIDRLSNKIDGSRIYRYLPDEHYWPERSVKKTTSLSEVPTTQWRTDVVRPLQLLPTPEPIDVAAPIPDYPPMLFRHKGNVHNIVRADGPERIEQEWWLQQGQHRDYYRVEDEHGNRYWLFRLGHYHDEKFQWFLHGYFA